MKTKGERQAAATQAQLQRTVNRLYALSLALLRAETAYDKYHEEATKLFASGKSDDDLVAEIPTAISGLHPNTLIRTGSLLSVYLGLLWAVVEGWRNWGFADVTVAELLKSPFVKDLKGHRNAIFHVSEVTDPRIMQWGLDPARVSWAKALASALRAALLGLHTRLGAKATVALKSTNK